MDGKTFHGSPGVLLRSFGSLVEKTHLRIDALKSVRNISFRSYHPSPKVSQLSAMEDLSAWFL